MKRTKINGKKCPFGCNGHVTAVAVGQSQRLYDILVSESLPGIISASSKAVECTKGYKLNLSKLTVLYCITGNLRFYSAFTVLRCITPVLYCVLCTVYYAMGPYCTVQSVHCVLQ
jgi:hypothetical protein